MLDIVQNGNGNGNDRYRRGNHTRTLIWSRGSVMTDCNVSNNAMEGVLVVSGENIFLTVTRSDHMWNWSMQLDLPPSGMESCRRCVCMDTAQPWWCALIHLVTLILKFKLLTH